jgi:hypothetical protein
LEGDSISINISGNGIKYPFTIISLHENKIIVSNENYDLETGHIWFTDTTVTNDSLYDEVRNQVYYWLFKDNTVGSKPRNKYSERGLIWIKTEVWVKEYDRKKLLAARNYYYNAGNLEYKWSKEFREFYRRLYQVQRALK